jgi:hypothetical protein
MNMVCLQINQGKSFSHCKVVIMCKERGYLSPASIRRSARCCRLLINENFIYISLFFVIYVTLVSGGGKS